MVEIYPFSLQVDALTVPVTLGVGDEERAAKQDVRVWVKLFYPKPPAAAGQDMADYLCYDDLCARLLTAAAAKPYHLIEFLCADFFRLLRSMAPEEVRLWIKVQKSLPQGLVAYDVEGASVIYTDLPEGVRP